MDRAYIECCAHFTSAYTNWNEAFNTALERDGSTMAAATHRQEEIYRVERSFEAEALAGAALIVSMDDNAARPLPGHLLCYHNQNVFYRVLPDTATGRSYVAALRGILFSDSALLTVPLSVVVMYRGTPVLAQALAPLSAEPRKVLGSGHPGSEEELAAEIQFIADAVNIPLPDQIICEAYAGMDGRVYVTNTNITTIALDDATLLGGPLKRTEMLALCPRVSASCEDTLEALASAAVLKSLREVVVVPLDKQQKLFCDTLHFYGINLCLLKGVFETFRDAFKNSREEYEQMKSVIAVEMIARTIKQEFYLEAQAKRLGMDEIGLNKSFTLHIKDAFDVGQQRNRFLKVAMRKYAIANDNGEDEELLGAVHGALRDYRDAVVERVSALTGARASSLRSTDRDSDTSSSKRVVTWIPFVIARTVPRLRDPKMCVSLVMKYETLHTNDDHSLAFVLPLEVKVSACAGQLQEALRLARAAARLVESRHGPSSLRNLYAGRTLCRQLFSLPTLDHVREGCEVMVSLLQKFKERVSPLTLARLHIEAGYWLLRSAEVMDVVTEAVQHFRAAEYLIPVSVRSGCGAWLFIQPRLGLLRCRQVHKGAFNMPVQSFVSDALFLSKVMSPADYFAEYLWELGMELGVDGQYESAAQVLTIAVSSAKKIRNSTLDVGAMIEDTLNIYRAFDPKKYNAYCDALEST